MFSASIAMMALVSGAAAAAAASTVGAADVPRGLVRARIAAVHDSNILIAPDSVVDQGTPSGFADYRLVTSGEVKYWAFMRGRHYLGPRASASLTNTAQAEHAAGDPYVFALAVPYVMDHAPGGIYRLVVRPSIQSMMMDPALTSRKTTVQRSLRIAVENTWRTSRRFDTHLNVELRRDQAEFRESVGDDDVSATRGNVELEQRVHPAGDPVRTWRVGLGYRDNRAVGRNARYVRTDYGFGYAGPLFGGVTFALDAFAYRLKFARPADPRRDLNLGARGVVRVPITDWCAAEVDATYARNDGLGRAFDYERVQLSTALTVATGF